MLRKLINILFLILSAGILFSLKSDEDFLNKLKSGLSRYLEASQAEKIYLHTDKRFYFPGEDIWFTIYLLDGTTHKPSLISDVSYVELIDPRGNLMKKLTVPVFSGTAKGDFNLGKESPGGIYTLKAYTLWILNSGEELVFQKKLTVQKIISPNLLLKLDLDKEAYSPGDIAIASLSIRDLMDNPVRSGNITYSIFYSGNRFSTQSEVSDQEGKASLKIYIPDTLNTEDGIINVQVGDNNINESISRSIPIILSHVSLRFFPEGGYLVSGTKNKIAFEAVNRYNKPADISGNIFNSKNELITSFESYHMGMGSFDMTPKENESYYAIVNKPDLKGTRFDLPEIKNLDYAISLQGNSQGEIVFHVFSRHNNPFYLVGQVRGKIIYEEKINTAVEESWLTIPDNDFPTGVAQFTLFNESGLPQAERLVYIDGSDKLKIELITSSKTFGLRDRVQVLIKTTDKNNKPVAAQLSMSVADDKILTLADDKQDNILSYFLLSSDLTGKIEEPSFYFDENEPKAKRSLDLLMMVKGWRRFRWEEIDKKPQVFKYSPEKFSQVNGIIFNTRNKKPVRTRVYLFEMNNARRVAQLKTGVNGQFEFFNVDPTATIEIVAKSVLKKEKNWNILLNSRIPIDGNVNSNKETGLKLNEGFIVIPGSINEDQPEIEEEEESIMQGSLSPSLENDVTSLSEVIVTGYGGILRKEITGSVIQINPIETRIPSPGNVEQMIGGRIAGVTVTNTMPSGNNLFYARICSSGSVMNQQPLIIIDGYPINQVSENISAINNLVDPEEISLLTVFKAPEASQIYGSRAAYGAIVITTKKGYHYNYYDDYRSDNNLTTEKNYVNLRIQNYLKRSAVREFYRPAYDHVENQEAILSDFRQTICWIPLINTDSNGTYLTSFFTSDAKTVFRITVEGTSDGRIGRSDTTFSANSELDFDIVFPPYALEGDTMKIPFMISNNTEKDVQGVLLLPNSSDIQFTQGEKLQVSVGAGKNEIFFLTAFNKGHPGLLRLTFEFQSKAGQKRIVKSLKVLQRGFPAYFTFSANKLEYKNNLSISGMIPGSFMASFIAYNNRISELLRGMESILREPHGCFEQVSSSAYPNIMVLKFLKASKNENLDAEKLALKYIGAGYPMLKQYEISGGGFEWFGHPPAHEGLTAYGLMELIEMKEVYDKVDNALIDRTKNWLLDRRDGDGGFNLIQGKYGFSGASNTVSNAYIVFALSQSGITNIEKEYLMSYRESLKSKDAYRLALMLNASANLNKTIEYDSIEHTMIELIQKYGLGNLPCDHSITRSYGSSLQIETAALTLMGFLKNNQAQYSLIKAIADYLVSTRTWNSYGSTQGTILALKALTEYELKSAKFDEDGAIQLAFNKTNIINKPFFKGQKSDILIDSIPLSWFSEGANEIRVQFQKCEHAFNYSFTSSWMTNKPSSSNQCVIDFNTHLMDSTVRQNEITRLKIEIINKTKTGQPMTIAIVGIPGGLSLQPWQLKELLDKNVFDYYEIIDNYLVLYYKELGPEEHKIINLDLTAGIPGYWRAPAGSAYLYYTNEFKDWEKGVEVLIKH